MENNSRVAERTQVEKVFNRTFGDCQNVVYIARVTEVTAWRVGERVVHSALTVGRVSRRPDTGEKVARDCKAHASAGKTSSSLSYAVPDSAKRDKHRVNLYARRT